MFPHVCTCLKVGVQYNLGVVYSGKIHFARYVRLTNGGRGAHHYQMHVFFRALLKLANPPVLALLLPSIIRAKHCFLRPKKEDQVARIGGKGGGGCQDFESS